MAALSFHYGTVLLFKFCLDQFFLNFRFPKYIPCISGHCTFPLIIFFIDKANFASSVIRYTERTKMFGEKKKMSKESVFNISIGGSALCLIMCLFISLDLLGFSDVSIPIKCLKFSAAISSTTGRILSLRRMSLLLSTQGLTRI